MVEKLQRRELEHLSRPIYCKIPTFVRFVATPLKYNHYIASESWHKKNMNWTVQYSMINYV